MDKKLEKEKLDKISKGLIIFAGIFILASFVLPFLFTHFSFIDFTGTEEIGDTISGIMNPFISIASIAVMFLAFYMQYKANQLQRELFNEQMQSDKEQFKEEITEQRKQFEKNQFENQFFEMLKTHKENINEISIETIYYTYDGYSEKNITHTQLLFGRNVLGYIIEEINIAYYIQKALENDNSNFSNSNFSKAYYFVWNGIENEKQGSILDTKTLLDYLIIYRNNVNRNDKKSISEILYEYKFSGQLEISYSPNKRNFIPFNNHSSTLGHYYRHLFQMVKSVVSKDFLTYEEKRNYLRILRAQMSNAEQVLLFYNWLSGYGSKWECETNHFLTDYRMIHNIWQEMIIEDFNLERIFNAINPNYLKENGRKNDYLFEFED
ncbi:putative phage abortive infection protein [Viscerimonas tarda]